MRKTLFLFATAIFLCLGVPQSRAANASLDFFYDQLSDYGDWVEVGDYGYGWQPRDVDANWRPYSDGRWAYTEVGWTWVSNEPYGWAVYHYGRWARLQDRGWVWIPGTEWAPAWVSWRRSPEHIGWAPLPPEATFHRGFGFSEWVDSYYDIGPSAYRFVSVRDFGAPRLNLVFVDPRENLLIIRRTTNITRITYVNGVVNDGGPRYEDVSQQSAEPVRRLRLERQVEVQGDVGTVRGEQLRAHVEGDSLRVFAPGFDPRASAPPRKVGAKIDKVEINHGWKDAGPAADVEKLHAKVRGESKAPQGLPTQPKFEKLAVQAASPASTPPVNEKPALAAPGATPAGKGPKDGRKPKNVTATPPAAVVVPPVAPVNPAAPEAPLKPEKPSTTGKTPGKPGPTVLPDGEPVPPEHKGKNHQAPGLPPTPVEPKAATPHPEVLRKFSTPAESPEKKNEHTIPPDLRKPKKDAPVASGEPPAVIEKAKPKLERPAPPTVVPGSVPPGTDPKGKSGKDKDKGKGKDDKKSGDDSSKTQ